MVRMGIIGTGGMAEYQAKKFSEVEGCVLTACKDHKAAHAEEFARRFAIPAWYSSIDALLGAGAVDAVTCVVIDSRHRALCESVLAERLPLFCEKPLARTVGDCLFLTETAAEAAVPNLVNFSKRNAPALSALRSALEEGLAGEVLAVDAEYLQGWVASGVWGDWMTVPRWKWRLLPEHGTAGVAGDLGTHLVDALLYLFGGLEVGSGRPAVLDLDEAMERGLVPARDLGVEFRSRGAKDGATTADETAGRAAGTVPVRIEASARLGPRWRNAPVRLRVSWVDAAETDSFLIAVTGSRGRLELDLKRSRDAIRFLPADGSPPRDLAFPRIPSTYELFVRMAEAYTHGGRSARTAAAADIPTFAHALTVQRTLEALLPGVMPQ